MTPQEVIKKFMARLANHGFSNATNDLGTAMLDAAVRASSRFSSIEKVLNAMKADQVNAEKEAVKEIFGEEKLLSELTDDQKNQLAKDNENAKNLTNAFYNGASSNDANAMTVEGVIKERKAYIFLEKYCGIQLPTRYWIKADGSYTWYSGDNGLTGNTDTGAITGLDANITLKAGDTDFYGNELDLSALAENYGLTLEEDGSLIIGTGEEKTDRSVVPEIFLNTYTASTSAAQKINTGSRNWVVQATDSDDTINAGGADSINAGAGNDSITVNGSGATVTSGEGADTIEISAHVNDVTVTDFNSEDTMTISGSFEIGAAKIEDMQLVITDKTGTRKLKLGDFTNVLENGGKVNVSGASTTIAKWLTDSGIDLDKLEETTYAASVGVGSSNVQDATNSTEKDGGGRIDIDPEYKPTPLPEPKRGVPTLAQPEQSANVGGETSIEVNLDDLTTLGAAGTVTVDGAQVGSVSSTFPDASTFTRNGLTIHLLGQSSSTDGNPTSNGESLITPLTLDELTESQKAIIAGLFKWWAADCLALNEESYGVGFNSDTTMCKDIGLFFFNDGKDSGSGTLATVWNWQRNYSDGSDDSETGDGTAYQLMLNVNMRFYNGVDSDNVDGEGSGTSALLDRTLAHEFNHAVWAANVNFFGKLPKFIKEGVAELTHGIDDERTSTIFKIAYDDEELAAGIDMNNTGTGYQDKGDGYAGGFMFWRYFAKQAALQTLLRPAFGDITVNVDFNSLTNLAAGNVLYIDTAAENPTVQVAADSDAFAAIEDPTYTLCNIGTIKTYDDGGFYYQVDNDLFKQLITTGGQISEVYGVNANVQLTGSDSEDGVQIVEGSTAVNTGAGNDIIQVMGQYATIDAGAGNDQVYLVEGGHHSINLGEGDNYIEIQGNVANNGTFYYTRNYGNTITGGAAGDQLFGGDFDLELAEGTNQTVTVHPQIYNHQIDLGDGDNDVALSYLFDSSIKTGAGNDSITLNRADNTTIDAGDGANDIYVNGMDNTTITTGAQGDNVSVISGSANVIMTGDGSDSLGTCNNTSTKDNLFDAGKGDDKITVGAGKNSTFLGGEGDDQISFINFSGGDSVITDNLIDAGAGSDLVTVYGSNNTIYGGADNDTIYSYSAGGNHFHFSGSFGNDSISGFNAKDIIHIAQNLDAEVSQTDSGKYTVTVKNGDDVKGTIDIFTASDVTFNAEQNITKDLEEEIMDTLTLSGGAGTTPNNPYIISKVKDWTELMTYVNGTEGGTEAHDCAGLYFKVQFGEGEEVEFPYDFSLGENFAGTIEIPVEIFATVFTEDEHALSDYKANLTASGKFEDNEEWSYALTSEKDAEGNVNVTLTVKGEGEMPAEMAEAYDFSYVKTLQFEGAITSIGDNAFPSCFTDLTEIKLPATIVTIGSSAFAACEMLETINWDECTNLTTIKEHAFDGCNSEDEDGNPLGLGPDLTIPASVTYIGEGAFSYNYYTLKNVTISAANVSIGAGAFSECYVLETVDLSTCTGLTALEPNEVDEGGNPLSYKPVEHKLADNMFSSCSALTSVTLPSDLQIIGKEAFSDCESLETVNIPTTITEIGDSAFNNCKALTELDLSECTELTTIGDFAFNGCESLESITLPSSIESIGTNAFYGCDKLESVKVTFNDKRFIDGEIKEANTEVDLTEAIKAGKEIECLKLQTLTGSETTLKGAYHVTEDVTFSSDITLGGKVVIILGEGATLTVNGSITGGDESSFNYYGGGNLKVTGTLKADSIYLTWTNATDIIEVATYDGNVTLGNKFFSDSSFIAVEAVNYGTSFSQTKLSALNDCLVIVPEGIEIEGARKLGERTAGGENEVAYDCAAGEVTLKAAEGSYLNKNNLLYESATVTISGTETDLVNNREYSVYTPPTIDYCAPKLDSENHKVYYEISSAAGFTGLAKYVTETSESTNNLTLKLTANIALPDDYTLTGFTGKIDGGGYLLTNVNNSLSGTVTNLKYNGTESISGSTNTRCYTLNVAEDANITATPAESATKITFDGVDYYAADTQVTISPKDGYLFKNDGQTTEYNITKNITATDAPTIRGGYFGTGNSGTWKLVDGVLTVSGTGELSNISWQDGELASVKTINISGATFGVDVSGMSALEEITFSGSGTLSSTFGESNTSLKTIDLQGGTFTSDISGLNNLEITVGEGTTFNPSTVGDTHTDLTINVPLDTFNKVLDGTETGKLTECTSYLAASGKFNEESDFTYEFKITDATSKNVTLTIGVESTTMTNMPTGEVSDDIELGQQPTVTHPWPKVSGNITEVVVSEGVTEIGMDSFGALTSMTKITLPSTVTKIDNWAFEYCTGLTEINLPAGLTELGREVFAGCSNLKKINLSECTELTKLGDDGNQYDTADNGVFYGCTALEEVDLSGCAKLATLGSGTFKGCTNLKTLNMSGCTSLTTLSKNMLADCTSLETFTLPENLETLSEGLFSGCTSLKTVNLPASLTALPKNLFSGCTSLNNITIPDKVTTIGESAFSGCTSLTSITIPDGVTTIGANAFSGCTSLTSITLPDSVTTIGAKAFSGCGGSLAVNVAAADKAIVVGGKVFGTGDTVNIASAVTANEEEVTIGSLALSTEEITYLDPSSTDGKSTATSAIVLSKDVAVSELAAGTYYVNDTVSLTKDLKLDGDVKIILGSNANLSAPGQISGGNLSVYSAESGGGKFSFDDITGTFNYYGGNVDAWKISGTATITWTSETDKIRLGYFGDEAKVTFATGKRFYDAKGHAYDGELDENEKTALADTRDTEGTSSTLITTLNPLNGYIITLPEGVSTADENATKIGETNSYIVAKDVKVTLTINNGTYLKDDGKVYAGSYDYTMPGNDVSLEVMPTIVGLSFVYDETNKTGYYGISSTENLSALAKYVNGTPADGDTTPAVEGNSCEGLTFKLTANVTAPDNFTLTDFAGTLDGDDHLLDGINSNGTLGSNTGKVYYHGTSTLTGGTKVYKISGIPTNATVSGTGTHKFGEDSYAESAFTLSASNGYLLNYDDPTTSKSYDNITADTTLTDTTVRGGILDDNLKWTLDGGVLKFYGTGNVPENFATTNLTGSDEPASVTAIDFPTNVTSIGASAFSGCTGLTSITLPTSVTSIGASAFDSTTTVNVGETDKAVVLGGNKVVGTGTQDIKSLLTAEVTLSYPSLEEVTVGTETKKAVVLTNDYTDLAAGDYYAKNDTTLGTVTVANGVNFILADGKTLTATSLNQNANLYALGGGTVSVGASVSKLNFSGTFTTSIDGDNVVLTANEKTLTLTGAAKLDIDTIKIDDKDVNIWFDKEDGGGAFLIKEAADFTKLATYTANHTTGGKTFKLSADIALPENFTLTNFQGTLDGGNHLLTGVNAALGGTIQNLYYRGTETLTGGTKVYTVTVPSGVTITSDEGKKHIFDGTDYYETGATLTFTGEGIAVKDAPASVTDADIDITEKVYYAVTVPENYALTVNAGGDSYESDGTTYYRGSITAKPKTGFTGDEITQEIAAVTTLEGTATFDTTGHYVYKEDGTTYTLATAENASGRDLTQVYKVTLPNYMTASGNNVLLTEGNDIYVTTAGEVSVTLDGYVSGDVKFGDTTLTESEGVYKFTPTGDALITAATFPKIDDLKFVAEDDNKRHYEISSAEDLGKLASYTKSTEGLTFKLTADITLESVTAINNFAGTFDGNEHLITASGAIFSSPSENASISGYQYTTGATADEKLTRVYKLTAPDGYTLSDAASEKKRIFGSVDYFEDAAQITFGLTATDTHRVIDKVDDAAATEGKFTVTVSNADKEVKVDYHIQLADNGEAYSNDVANISVLGGKGDDEITNSGAGVTIDGGDGDDQINLTGGTGAVVDVSKGNDSVSVASGVKGVVINGFSAGDVINLSAAAELQTVDGGVKAGEVTLSGASMASISNDWSNQNSVFLYQQTTTAGGAYLDGTAIKALSTAATENIFSLSGAANYTGITPDKTNQLVTLSASNLGEANVSISGEYKIILADGVAQTATDLGAAFELVGTTATYYTDRKGKYYTGSGTEEIIYNASVASGDNVALSGISDVSKVSVEDSAVSIAGGENVSVVSNTGSYSFKLGSDFNGKFLGSADGDSIEVAGNGVTIDLSGNDSVSVADGVTSLTVENFGEGDQITFANDVTATAYEDEALKVTAGDKVITISGAIAPTRTDNTWLSAKTYGKMAGDDYIKDGKKVTFGNVEADTYFTLSGLKDGVTKEQVEAAVEVKDGKVTFNSDNVLDENKEVSISGTGYELAVGSDIESKEQAVDWKKDTEDTSKYNYVGAGYNAGWRVNNDGKLIHQADTRDSFSISGLGTATLGDNVIVNDKNVEVKEGAFTTSHDKISLSGEGYTLEVKDSLVADIEFKQEGNKVTLAGTSAGYKNVSGAYEWQTQVGGEQLTITGLKDDATLTAEMFTRGEGNAITFKPTQGLLPENPTTLTISSGTIDTSVLTVTSAEAAHWSGTTWISDKTASSWTTGASEVTFTAATGGENLFTLGGLKDGVTLSDAPTLDGETYKVTLAADTFEKSGTITVTAEKSNATLEFAGIGTAAESVGATLSKDGVYSAAHTPEYFNLTTADKVTTYTYTKAAGDYGFTISGLNLTEDLSGNAIDSYFTVDNGTVLINSSALGTGNIALSNLDKDADNDGTEDTTIKLALADDVVKAANTLDKDVALTKSDDGYVYTAESYKPWYELKDESITYHAATGGENLFTLSGLGTATLGENVIVTDKNVEVKSGAFTENHDKISLSGEGYTLTVNDSPVTDIEFKQDENKVTLSGTSAGYAKVGDAYEWQAQVGGEQLTITGLKDDATLTAEMFTRGEGNAITFKPTQGLLPENPTTLTISSGTIDTSGLTKTAAEAAHWSGTTWVSDKTASSWTSGTSSVTFTPATGGENLFTISGLKDGVTEEQIESAVNISDKTITINSDNVLDTAKTVSVTGDYTLALADALKSTAAAESWTGSGNTFNYLSAGYTTGYSVDGNQISYRTDNRTSFSVSGLNSAASLGDNVNVSGTTVTISSGALDGKDVALSGDYTLALSGVSGPQAVGAGWSGTTYRSSYIVAGGYSLSGSKKIIYTAPTSPTEIFSVSGTTSTSGLSVSKSGSSYVVNVSDAAVNYSDERTITLSGNATFAYASAFSGNKSQTLTSAASLTNGTYTSAAYAKWTELDDTSFTVHPATSAEKFTISGLSSAAKLNDNVLVTDGTTTAFEFKAAALDKQNVAISGGSFSVKLNSDVDTTAESIPESKNLSGTTLSYTAPATGESYSATATGVTYSAGTGGEQFTLTGINSADGVSISGKQVTVNESALNMAATSSYTVALTGDFTLNFLGNTSNAEIPASLVSGSYTSAYTPAYFTASENSYTFTPEGSKTTFTISGLGSGAKLDDNVLVDGKSVKISSGAFTTSHDKISVSDSSYTLEVTDSLVEDISFAQDGNTVTLAGTSAGYAKVGSAYEWQTQIGGEQLTITGLKSGATLSADMFTRSGEQITFKPTDELLAEDATTISITGGVIDTSALSTTEKIGARWDGFTYISERTASSWTTGASSVTFTPASGGTDEFTISGVAKVDGVTVDGKTVKVASAAFTDNHDKISLSDSSYTLEVTDSLVENISFAQDGNKVTLPGTSTGYSKVGSAYEWQNQVGGEQLTISGLKDGATLTADMFTRSGEQIIFKPTDAVIEGTTLTISNGVIDTSALSTTEKIGAHWDGFTYISERTASSWTSGTSSVTFTPASGGENLFTISGVANVDGVSVNGKEITLSASNLNAQNVTVTGDYTLALDGATDNVLTTTEAVDANYADNVYTTAKSAETYTASGNAITYAPATGGDEIKFSGVADDATAKNFYVNGSKVTVGKEAVKTDGTEVKLLTDGYTLKLGRGMSASETVDANYANGTYTTAGTTEGYTLADDSIAYVAGTTKEIKFSGVADDATAKNFYVNGSKVTVGKEAVKTDGTEVKLLTDGYTLKLGRGMSASETVDANYANGTYTTAGTTDGYTLTDDSIAYVAGTTKEIKFSGVADDATAKNFYVNGSKVTIGKEAVKTDGTEVKLLTDGYTLKLGRGMSASETVDANYANGTYTTAGTTDGYTLTDDSIAYVAGTTKEIKFSGVADDATAKNFWLSGSKITIGKDAVPTDGTEVKLLTDGYTLKLGRGMSTSETVDANYANGTYTTAGTTDGYTLTDDSIAYVAGTTKEIKFSGVADDATAKNFYVNGSKITIGKEAVPTDGTEVKLLTDGYTLKLGRGMSEAASNEGTLSGDVYTYGGVGAGYILGTDGKTISYAEASDPTLQLTGVASALKTPANKVVALEVENFSSNLTIAGNTGGFKFSVESGDYSGKILTGSARADIIGVAGANLTVNTGAGNDSIKSLGGTNMTVNAGAGSDTIAGSAGADVLDGGAGNDVLYGGSGNDSLLGSAGNDSLVGAAGADTLWGSAGNDTLTGGSGSDTFIYKPNEGSDTISDFASNDMLQILKADGSAGAFSSSTFSGTTLTLAIEGGGSVILTNVSAGQSININGTAHTISGNTLK